MSYDFSQLSSLDFEELCRDLLQQEDGIRYELFKPGRDQGIDARHLNGDKKTIVQCKHYLQSGIDKLCSVLKKEEFSKVEKLNPSRYILITSVPLSVNNKQRIQAILHPFIRSQADILGQEDVNNLINRHPRIEQQHFKLWLGSTKVLERILNNDVFNQSEQLLERAREKIPVYVQNSSFFDAAKIINEHQIVLISGEPGVGKTTLAEMLILAHIKKGFQPIEIRNPRDAYKVFHLEQKIIFYFDDFLGLTYLGDNPYVERLTEVVHLIDLVRRSKGSKIVLTSREYIIAQALQKHERFSKVDCLNAKYQLCLSTYTNNIKAKILYNHLFFSNLKREYIEEFILSGTHKQVIAHKNYRPRLISWLTQASRLRSISFSEYPKYFLGNLDDPKEIWLHAFRQISLISRKILVVLLSLGSSSSSSLLQKSTEFHLLKSSKKYGFSYDYEDYYLAVSELIGSFLRVEGENILFHDPSVKDFLESYISERAEVFKDILESAINIRQIFEIWKLVKRSDFFTEEIILSDVVRSLLNLEVCSFNISGGQFKSRILNAVGTKYIQALGLLIEVQAKANSQDLQDIICFEVRQAKELPVVFRGGLVEWICLARKVKPELNETSFIQQILQNIEEVVMKDIDGVITITQLAYLVEVAEDDVLPSLDKDICSLLFLEGLQYGYFYNEVSNLKGTIILEDYLTEWPYLVSTFELVDDPLVKQVSQKLDDMLSYHEALAEMQYKSIRENEEDIGTFEGDKEDSSEEQSFEEIVDLMFMDLLEN